MHIQPGGGTAGSLPSGSKEGQGGIRALETCCTQAAFMVKKHICGPFRSPPHRDRMPFPDDWYRSPERAFFYLSDIGRQCHPGGCDSAPPGHTALEMVPGKVRFAYGDAAGDAARKAEITASSLLL
jgi:hypothetical protein